MPFRSEAQRRYLFANEPKIAKAWSHGKSSVTGKKEGKVKNKGLPWKVKKGLKKKGLTKNYR
jgi:hypothetical protein